MVLSRRVTRSKTDRHISTQFKYSQRIALLQSSNVSSSIRLLRETRMQDKSAETVFSPHSSPPSSGNNPTGLAVDTKSGTKCPKCTGTMRRFRDQCSSQLRYIHSIFLSSQGDSLFEDINSSASLGVGVNIRQRPRTMKISAAFCVHSEPAPKAPIYP